MLATKKWFRCPGHAGRRTQPETSQTLRSGLAIGCACLLLGGCGKSPGQSELHQGVRLIEAGKPAEAVEVLGQAARILATNQLASAQALNHLGIALQQSGRSVEAAEAYTGALNRDLNLFAARYNRGCLRLEQGNYAEAIRDLSTYVTHQPREARGWLQLGFARWHAGDTEAAAGAFRQAAQLAASRSLQARALNGAGLCCARQQQSEEALRFFEAALQLDPSLRAAVLNQAVVLESGLHDRLRAVEKYEAYLDSGAAGATDQAVRDHVRLLAMSLRPPLPSDQELATQGAEARARITNLFSRVGSVGPVAPTGVPPAIPLTGAPPALSATTDVRLADVPTSAIPALALTSAAPALVLTGAPAASVTGALAQVVSTSPVPASVIQTGAPPEIVVASAPPPLVAAAPSAEGEGGAKPLAEASTNTGPVAEAVGSAPVLEEVSVESPPVLMAAGGPASAGASGQDSRVGLMEAASAFDEPDSLAGGPTGSEAGAVAEGVGEAIAEAKAEAEAGAPAEAEAGEAEGRSFLARINPLNLFRRAPQEKRITPLPPKPGTTPIRGAASEAAPPLPVQPAPPVELASDAGQPAGAASPTTPAQPARPAFPRYRYQSPERPAVGDAAASRQHFLRGVQDYHRGDFEAASAAYGAAIKADPANFEARYNAAALAYRRGKTGDCLKESEVALAIEPSDAAARFNFALALQKAGFPLDAAVELERILASHPGSAEAHLALGALYADTIGDPGQAREHYQRVLDLQPGHAQAAALRRWLAIHRPVAPR